MELYSRAFKAHPAATALVSGVVVGATADVVVQKHILHQPLDLGRVARYGVQRGFFTIFMQRYYALLDRVVPSDAPFYVRLAVDQLIGTWAVNSVFVLSASVANGTFIDTASSLPSRLPGIVRSAMAVWIPANFISFRFVPPEKRVLFGQMISFFWGIFVAWKLAKAKRAGPGTPKK